MQETQHRPYILSLCDTKFGPRTMVRSSSPYVLLFLLTHRLQFLLYYLSLMDLGCP